jgi:hypothetical protein
MIKFAFVNEHGEVVATVHPSEDGAFTDGEQVDDDTVRSFDYAESDADVCENWYWRDGWQKDKPARPSEYHYWANYQWNLDEVNLAAEVRETRNRKLYRSDWTQAADSPLSDAAKAEWVTYRQALRDVPANYTTINSLDEVSWPTEPGG